MKTIPFKVTLLSDVIINQKAATEGNQNTLDFIPGNTFLGVAAGIYKDIKPEESFTLFHSGKVRFGDAHPLFGEKRALKVPSSWYKLKDSKEGNNVYVHHGMPKAGLKDEHGNPVQVKQYREDYVVVAGQNQVSKVKIDKRFAIKSAYDSKKRRSEDAKMYGYESLQAGTAWYFELVLDEDISPELEKKLIDALTGHKSIGRSSTAQYGRVLIEPSHKMAHGFSTWKAPQALGIQKPVVFAYAESRLIFFDEYGQPTLQPTAEQLGFDQGSICWEMSQVRTFQYAPFNNTRKAREADRCGIEKGSVFCIAGASSSETEKWVGSYQNEGFGRVLINPDFLEFTGENGEAKYKCIENSKDDSPKSTTDPKEPVHIINFKNSTDTKVWKHLIQQSQKSKAQIDIFRQVNNAVQSSFEKSFKVEERFASQWGTIRAIATQIRTKNTGLTYQKEKELLMKKLFEERIDPKTGKRIGVGYLKHGVAAEKWEWKAKELEEKIKAIKPEYAIEFVINLAAEMAKKCRRD